ncbi:MAG TPA: nucleoside deaminase [Bacteroidales bacterium]|jgi:tRNA(adenine34) deaminase|nr:nucleoside deaminase [Bacteroidales bacterium]HOS57402.1 nucleoside deaminase [Bacteroidales bacterium]HPY81552.1 nucleoside deaminase [Bacteroidales bacterium]HQA86321.1 nucleoside deaminase [Bacteroidales bacterium]HRR05112.1 nucleoside deaminase [Bacteroidales bacterium]
MLLSDEYFMQKAYLEAEEAFFEDEVPIGAVVVLDGKIIGKGHNRTEKLQDVTAHAEIEAITAAANYLGAKYLGDCKLYTTLEPCTMCAGAIALAQVGELVYASSDPKKGYSLYSPTLLHRKTIVKKGILEADCSQLLKDFFIKKRK